MRSSAAGERSRTLATLVANRLGESVREIARHRPDPHGCLESDPESFGPCRELTLSELAIGLRFRVRRLR